MRKLSVLIFFEENLAHIQYEGFMLNPSEPMSQCSDVDFSNTRPRHKDIGPVRNG